MEIAAGRVDITPSTPVVLAGSSRRKLSTRVAERLEANVIALRIDPSAAPAVIVSVDLLYPGRLIREIVERCYHGVPTEKIMLGASHTHRGPMTDDTKPGLGRVDYEYIAHFAEQIQSLSLEQPTMSWSPARVHSGTAYGEAAINRRLRKRLVVSRRPRINGYVNAPNPFGFKDEAIRVLVGRSRVGKALFVLWTYSCHPVGYPSSDEVAGHYPAVVRDRLREVFNDPDLPVVFLQGFSGDIRPSATSRLNGLSRRTRRAVTGPVFSDMTPAGYQEWCEKLALTVTTAAKNAVLAKVDDIITRRASMDSAMFVVGAAHPEVTFQSILLAPDICIVGASAEVVAEYVPLVSEISAWKNVLCVGCLDHVFGYAPTTSIHEEGGYEGGGFCDAFSLQAVNPSIERNMIAGFNSVLQLTGRCR